MPNAATMIAAHEPAPSGSPEFRIRSHWLTVALIVLVGCQVAFAVLGARKSFRGGVDFRAFYAAGRITASGHASRLYDRGYEEVVQRQVVGSADRMLPFLYPPSASLLFVPLSLLQYKAAFACALLLNVGLTIWIAGLLRASVPGLRALSPIVTTAGCFSLLPVTIALMQGQITFLLLLVSVVAYALLGKNRAFLAGCVFALALMKFQIALPVALLFLLWRNWRFLGGFLCGASALVTTSILLVYPHVFLAYLKGLGSMGRSSLSDPAAARVAFGMYAGDMPTLHGLFFLLTKGNGLGQGAAILCSIGVMVFASRKKASLATALPAAMLVSYHMQAYDLALLLLPVCVILGYLFQALHSDPKHEDRVSRKAFVLRALCVGFALALLTVPLASLLLVHGLSACMALSILATLCAL